MVDLCSGMARGQESVLTPNFLSSLGGLAQCMGAGPPCTPVPGEFGGALWDPFYPTPRSFLLPGDGPNRNELFA